MPALGTPSFGRFLLVVTMVAPGLGLADGCTTMVVLAFSLIGAAGVEGGAVTASWSMATGEFADFPVGAGFCEGLSFCFFAGTGASTGMPDEVEFAGTALLVCTEAWFVCSRLEELHTRGIGVTTVSSLNDSHTSKSPTALGYVQKRYVYN